MKQLREQSQNPLHKIAAALTALTRAVGFWVLLALLALLALNSFLATAYFDIPNTAEQVHYAFGGMVWNALAALFALAAVCWILHKKLWRHPAARLLEYALPLFYLGIGCFWVFSAGAVQYGEPERINLSATAFMAGEYSHLAPGGYNYMFPFQLGFTLYIEGVYHIFGAYNTTAVSLLNVAFAAGSYLLVAKISRALFPGGPVPLLTTLLLFCSLYLVPYTTFNYAILPGLFFALVGLYCALRYLHGHRYGFLAGALVCSALATVLKSNYLIFAVGIGIVVVLDTLGRPRLLPALLAAGLIAANLFGMHLVYAVYSARAGLGVNEGVPKLTWVAMGLKDDGELAPGWYNGDTYRIYPELGYDGNAARAQAKEDIRASLRGFAQNPAHAAEFFYKKLSGEWNEPTFGAFMSTWYPIEYGGKQGWVFRFFTGGGFANTTVAFLDRLHFILLGGAAFGIWAGRKKLPLAGLLPGIITIGGFLFFLVWEGKSQYVMPFAFILIPYAAAGLAAAGEGLLQKIKQAKK